VAVENWLQGQADRAGVLESVLWSFNFFGCALVRLPWSRSLPLCDFLFLYFWSQGRHRLGGLRFLRALILAFVVLCAREAWLEGVLIR